MRRRNNDYRRLKPFREGIEKLSVQTAAMTIEKNFPAKEHEASGKRGYSTGIPTS